jgi:NlpC/P60 family putative phage cell wall peptidase
MTTRADILKEARGWLGTRWQHQGSVKGIGCDCIGFVAGVARELGIAEAAEFWADGRVMGYGREPDAAMLVSTCERYMDRIGMDAALPGDVLVLRFSREPQHFALLSQRNPDYMIHGYAQARKVVENRIDALWRSRILSAWRFRGVYG